MILKAEGRSPGRPRGSMRGERPVFFCALCGLCVQTVSARAVPLRASRPSKHRPAIFEHPPGLPTVTIAAAPAMPPSCELEAGGRAGNDVL